MLSASKLTHTAVSVFEYGKIRWIILLICNILSLRFLAQRKDDCVKKLFVIIIFALLSTGCQSEESKTETDLFSNDIVTVANNDDYSDNQDDLVYHDYGTGIELSSNSKIIISSIDLCLEDETAIICAINLEDNEVIKLYDYQPNQEVTFTPDSDGAYKIVAELSSGEKIDLTPKAMVETTFTEENSSGFIPLH